jgi:hypothetical protein
MVTRRQQQQQRLSASPIIHSSSISTIPSNYVLKDDTIGTVSTLQFGARRLLEIQALHQQTNNQNNHIHCISSIRNRNPTSAVASSVLYCNIPYKVVVRKDPPDIYDDVLRAINLNEEEEEHHCYDNMQQQQQQQQQQHLLSISNHHRFLKLSHHRICHQEEFVVNAISPTKIRTIILTIRGEHVMIVVVLQVATSVVLPSTVLHFPRRQQHLH